MSSAVIWFTLAAPAWLPALSPSAQQPQNNQQQATTPSEAPSQSQPATAQDCAQSKDTCELPPGPAAPPATAPSTQPAHDAQQGQAKSSEAPARTKNKIARTKKHKPARSAVSGPRKIVVRDGGTSEPRTQLSPTSQQAMDTRQNTDQLLASTQANLKSMSGRTLSANQQATVDQIKMFVEQANSALKDGDLQRGHNLAMKAHLLSDDLLRH